MLGRAYSHKLACYLRREHTAKSSDSLSSYMYVKLQTAWNDTISLYPTSSDGVSAKLISFLSVVKKGIKELNLGLGDCYKTKMIVFDYRTV